MYFLTYNRHIYTYFIHILKKRFRTFLGSILIISVLLFFMMGCVSKTEHKPAFNDLSFLIPDSTDIFIKIVKLKSEIAIRLESLGLVDIITIDSSIVVELIYSTSENFTGQILYDDLSEAYFQPAVAIMLSNAQKFLQDTLPGAKLLIYDAARPVSVQKKMWDKVKNTRFEKYVANPERTSLHNYGVAVDLTIIDKSGTPLDMGTPIDYFGKAAGNYDEILIKEGLISIEQLQNRQLLRLIMEKAGFSPIRGEWWHFNAFSLAVAKQRYNIIE